MCINKIKDIALKDSCFDDSEKYIDMLLAEELQNQRPGYTIRIKSY